MILIRCLAIAALGTAFLPTAQAQEKSLEAQVDIKKVDVGSQNTPQIQAQNVKDKRWNPKIWLEVDVPFGLKKGKQKGEVNPSPVVDSLDFKFYILLNKRDAAGKFIMLTAAITYLNANEDDRESHAMAFVSPSSLARVLSNPRFTAPDITPTAVAVVVTKGGALCGFHSQGGPAGAWWEKAENFSIIDGVLLPKSKTPFSPLWGDYDLETSSK